MPFDVAADLSGAPEDCRRFFDAIFTDRAAWTVKRLAWQLAVNDGTLASRFFRAGLPSPKRYAATAGFVRAAELYAAGMSSDDVASTLGLSSANAMDRAVREMLGLRRVEFRRSCAPSLMIERFRVELVIPYRATLLTFHPLLVAS